MSDEYLNWTVDDHFFGILLDIEFNATIKTLFFDLDDTAKWGELKSSLKWIDPKAKWPGDWCEVRFLDQSHIRIDARPGNRFLSKVIKQILKDDISDDFVKSFAIEFYGDGVGMQVKMDDSPSIRRRLLTAKSCVYVGSYDSVYPTVTVTFQGDDVILTKVS